MAKARKYYTLAVKMDGVWAPQFGDYDREVVEDEAADSYEEYKCKILTTGDTQAEIDAAIAKLNGK